MDGQISRRNFLSTAVVTSGVSATNTMSMPLNPEKRLPREVWVGSASLFGLHPVATIEGRIQLMLERMERLVPYKPDIICVPETFQTAWVDEEKPLDQTAEEPPGPVTERMAEFAKRNSCYIICAIETKEAGRFYNSAILLDRMGKISGIYHKAHPTVTEIAKGVVPGPLDIPLFETDFGKIGVQICYDLNWQEGWRILKKKGAEIVFFSSMFPGGLMLSAYAWMHHYYVVSATARDARIVDIGGDVLCQSGQFSPWIAGPMNLDKAFLEIWPYVLKFKDIEAKYGRKIHINILHPEDTATIESRDPEVRIHDVLREFEIPPYDEHIGEADEIQNKARL